MLRSNCKIVKNQVRLHVIECLKTSCNADEKNEKELLIDLIDGAFNHFYNDSYVWRLSRTGRLILHYTKSHYQVIVDFINCCPSEINTPVGNYEMRMLIKEWLHQDEKNAEKYNPEKVEMKYYDMIIRAMIDILKSYDIDFFDYCEKSINDIREKMQEKEDRKAKNK